MQTKRGFGVFATRSVPFSLLYCLNEGNLPIILYAKENLQGIPTACAVMRCYGLALNWDTPPLICSCPVRYKTVHRCYDSALLFSSTPKQRRLLIWVWSVAGYRQCLHIRPIYFQQTSRWRAARLGLTFIGTSTLHVYHVNTYQVYVYKVTFLPDVQY